MPALFLKDIKLINKYEVIIIGGGVAGLVCGAYLSQAGMKVLVVEKNSQVGGYCRTLQFDRALKFDICIHSLASCRPEGAVGRIISELGLNKYFSLISGPVPNIVFWGNKKIRIYRNINKTINEFSSFFTEESLNISKFFKFIGFSEPLAFTYLKGKAFYTFLGEYFNDSELKRIIAEMVLISTGISSSDLSAFIGCSTLREYILDAGYYHSSGVQILPDSLSNRIKDLNGDILLGRTVKEIILSGNHVKAVRLDDNEIYESDIVVSGCDVNQTFTKLIANPSIRQKWNDKLNKMIPSMSAFCLYMGVNITNNLLRDVDDFSSTLYFIDHNSSIKKTESAIESCSNTLFILSSPTFLGLKSLENVKQASFLLLTNAIFHDSKFWAKHKRLFAEEMIAKLAQYYPALTNSIFFKGYATPTTLKNWTFNYQGSAYGWAAIPAQIADPDLICKTNIEGLFLTGHWTTQAHGVISAAYTGRKTANIILAMND